MRSPALALGFFALLGVAQAQQPAVGAFVEGGTGVEIGGPARNVVVHRARTVIVGGASLGNREWPNESLRVSLVVELEPSASLGGAFAWAHRLGRWFEVHVGITGVIAPQSMLGPLLGARVRIPVAKGLFVVAGPDVKVFPIGSDVPDGTVVVVALASAGLHADF
jgi:hypothetical protein